jgi:hypothetical protein
MWKEHVPPNRSQQLAPTTYPTSTSSTHNQSPHAITRTPPHQPLINHSPFLVPGNICNTRILHEAKNKGADISPGEKYIAILLE